MGLEDSIRIKNNLIRATIAEFVGTLLLVFVSHSVGVAYSTVTMSTQGDPAAILMGATFGGGLSVFISLAAVINISGGHLNPAVTIGFAVTGQFSWVHVGPYLAAQYLAGFIAACLLYLTHYDLIEIVHENYANDSALGHGKTAHIFASAPAPHASNWGCFIQTFFGDTVLLIGIAAVVDVKNLGAPRWFYALGIAVCLIVVSVAFSGNGGPSLNPAADFPCRVFAWIAGWGAVIWAPLNGHYWYLTGLIAPHLGAAFGLLFYKVLIGAHFPRDSSAASTSTAASSSSTQATSSSAHHDMPVPKEAPAQP
ncbi:aquaporin-9-like protein [Leptotrombidium deliense]|uniref:Aquaporin-9-like protein n=1 Tax=Leptotrombidium deliense TaxID=299467 RepID=A0A443SFS5_9ACAR|nr:aquaporin-9-like protein [Leptotrombidium deliense]